MHEVLQRLQTELSRALSGLTPAQTQLRSGKDSTFWTIEEIVCHLTLTYSSSSEVVRARVEKGTPTKASPSLQQRVGQIYVTRLGRFPRGHKAPGAVDPRHVAILEPEVSGDELVRRATGALAQFDSLASAAEALFGNRRAISHLVLGPLSVSQWRRFHLTHGRHHIRQILAILRQTESRV